MSLSSSTHGNVELADTNAQKFLTFCLGEEHYGIPILRVREIIGLIPITTLPQTPSYVRGVMNLRGRIIPVIDLRSRFGLPEIEPTKETCIIIVDANDGAGEQSLTGVIVDTVREVQDIPASSMSPKPEFGCTVPLDYIEGMGRVRDRVILLLNVVDVLDKRCVDALAATTEESAVLRAAA